jgi:hypothetical protein
MGKSEGRGRRRRGRRNFRKRGADGATPSFIEKIGVRSHALEAKQIAGNLIDQQPIRLVMGVTKARPPAPERMIVISLGQWVASEQKVGEILEPVRRPGDMRLIGGTTD